MVAEGARVDVETVLQRFRELVRALQLERARRGVEPWHDCPITMPQLRALSAIAARPHGLSSRELASLLGVGASAITPLVDRLVERGVVRRHEDPHDRRIARLEVTAAGNDVLERMHGGQADIIRSALNALSPDELGLVATAFDVLRDAFERTATNEGNGA
jgi:DNA-binding MarR family transcriptional regulator